MSEELDFEATMTELERIARALDGEELDLDDALELFEAGVRHVRRANHLLEEVRGRVEELIETSSGEREVAEFDVPEAEADEP